MNGRKARATRALALALTRGNPEAHSVQHHNVRHKEVPVSTDLLNPATGRLEGAVFSFLTSTQVIPARRLYRDLKRAS